MTTDTDWSLDIRSGGFHATSHGTRRPVQGPGCRSDRQRVSGGCAAPSVSDGAARRSGAGCCEPRFRNRSRKACGPMPRVPVSRLAPGTILAGLCPCPGPMSMPWAASPPGMGMDDGHGRWGFADAHANRWGDGDGRRRAPRRAGRPTAGLPLGEAAQAGAEAKQRGPHRGVLGRRDRLVSMTPPDDLFRCSGRPGLGDVFEVPIIGRPSSLFEGDASSPARSIDARHIEQLSRSAVWLRRVEVQVAPVADGSRK